MESSYLLLIIVTMAIGLSAQGYVHHKLRVYNDVSISNGLTGEQCARQMLAYYGITDVEVRMGGHGQDFFDPRDNTITLSPTSFTSSSVTSTATACHEVGHACQYATSYTPMKIRGAIVPVVNLASNGWMICLLAGIAMNAIGLVWLAVIMYFAVVAFQVVTLPVEFDASRRAMAYMGSIGLTPQEQKGAFDVLRACALTYLAAALTSFLQLIWLLGKLNQQEE